jgi:histidinol-phosphate/aromatic aminotransferase/cobyric acid decarboxylase-like protein
MPLPLVHVNAGSELNLRQLFDRFGQQVHLLLPTYTLFPEIARRHTVTRLSPVEDFGFDLADFAPHDAAAIAVALAARGILVKPLGDAELGPGYMRVTAATPPDNRRFVDTLREILRHAP